MSDDLLDRTLRLLHQVEQRLRSPEEHEALGTARRALHFIASRGELHGFEDYVRDFGSKGPLKPLLTFATRQDADTWLESHPTPPHGALVGIAGGLYSVGFNRQSGLRVLVRLPDEKESDAPGAE